MGKNTIPKHTLVALVEDKPGVLNKISGLFRRRGFNISSLAVGHSEIPNLSRMTIVVEGDGLIREQAARQLRKQIGVMEVYDITDQPVVSRELTLIRVKTTKQTRGEIVQIVDIFRADIVDVASNSMVIEATGDEDKMEALLNLLEPFEILEIVRTGQIAMVRGSAQRENGDPSTPRPNGAESKATAMQYEDIGGV